VVFYASLAPYLPLLREDYGNLLPAAYRSRALPPRAVVWPYRGIASTSTIAASRRVSTCTLLLPSFIGKDYFASTVSLSTIQQFFRGRQANLTTCIVFPDLSAFCYGPFRATLANRHRTLVPSVVPISVHGL
jgi:hypothetical protein